MADNCKLVPHVFVEHWTQVVSKSSRKAIDSGSLAAKSLADQVEAKIKMLSYLAAVAAAAAAWIIKGLMRMDLFAPQVVNNQLNPVHLAIGIRCYQIQTEILGIPEQYGLFSSGPPRLQVLQGSTIPFLYFTVVFQTVVLDEPSLKEGNR
ncbi:hypothetical protein LY78DRAFT_689298 [Colletotrichum sublineola]|nr:hypothetical protein LY78DRAFT_689298 [Colletotrichum sublineola]